MSAPNSAPGGSGVFFDRRELDLILRLYGRKVAQGEWRDYGFQTGKDWAAVAVFRRAAEAPLYRIEKRPALASRQGAYAVTGAQGQILRRGRELEQVLKVFETGRLQAVD